MWRPTGLRRLLVAALLSAAAAAVVAPRRAAAQRATFGLFVGRNSAKLVTARGTTTSRGGVMAGAYAEIRTSRRISLRPEVQIAEKGGRQMLGPSGLSLRARYVEVPLLLRIQPTPDAFLRPYLEAGPALAVRIGCRIEGDLPIASSIMGCGDEDVPFFVDPLRTSDVSRVVGAGLAVGRGALGVRYDSGTSDIRSLDDLIPGIGLDKRATRTRTVTLYASVRLGGLR